MEFRFIDKVGVELEGGWNTMPSLRVKSDGSVNAFGSAVTGEVVTNPSSDIEKIILDIETNYPEVINKSCGFHIHTSFKNLNYFSCLTLEDFYEFFFTKMNQWGKDYPCKNPEFWDRLNGTNTFCLKDFNPELQLENSFSRYTQVNFCAFCHHKTVECRLLPMFKAKTTAIAALRAVLNVYEEWIANNISRLGRLYTENIEFETSQEQKLVYI